MQYIILPLFLIMTVNSNHTSKTENKDVIVTYSNHADAVAENKAELPKPKPKEKTEEIPDKIILMPEHMFGKKEMEREEEKRNDRNEERDSNEVVFIPNQKEVVRNEDYLNNPRIDDVMHGDIRTINDAMDRRNVISNTESHIHSDIIFLTGKNNENEKETERDRPIHGDARRSETTYTTITPILDCVNLDCDNTIDSLCGAKLERKTWKYRLFLNECFFRKVNCYFQNELNRYRQIPMENCQNAGVHYRRNSNPLPQPMYYPPMEKPVKLDNTRRSINSRRSLTLSVDGHACSHTCPVSCPDNYEPECAVSGQTRKVFVNHCKLDYNSCLNNIVWHSRPLSQCVGGKRADAQQNRAFIDWMQRVGIVDNKGKLVLS